LIDDPYDGYPVISPAFIGVTQGTPNVILIAGEFPEAQAREAFNQAWSAIAKRCREEIETRLQGYDYRYWKREWSLWEHHTWEFFHATGETISSARETLFQQKLERDWIGINWSGESSTLPAIAIGLVESNPGR
jgi:CRISPR-associated protein Cmr2